jgi:elongation factor Ts
MINITPESVKHLREQTGAGMMMCKQALLETNGNFDEAVTWLRKKGCDAAHKRSGRVASEGIAALIVDHHNAAIIEINCETDFVARNDKFQSLVDNLRKMSINFDEVADLKKAKYLSSDETVEDALLAAASTAGENINVRRLERFSVHRGIIGSYVHNALMHDGGKIAVLVVLESDLPVPLLQPLAKQLAMHVAAAKPSFLRIEDVDEESLRQEREIFNVQAMATGKPAEVIAKVVEGKVQRYYQDVVLLEQAFIIDNKIKIKDLIKSFETQHGQKVILQDFARYEVGEGI